MQCITIATFLLFAAASLAQNVIPSGTILPVKLNTSLNSKKSKAGQEIHGGLAQDVPLPSGFKIRVGAKLGGHVIAVTRASGGKGARLCFQFETLRIGRRTVSLTMSLRAIASMMEVHEAQLPATGPDRGTPQTAWVTQQIEDEANYHGGWPVTNGPDIVGKSLLSGGVLVRISSTPWRQCGDDVDHHDQT